MARVNETRDGFISVEEVLFKTSCFYTDVVRSPSRGHLKHMLVVRLDFFKKIISIY